MQYSGSVRKEGRKWYYTIELGKDNSGKRKQKKKRGFKTKKEAQIALSHALSQMNSGIYVEPSNQLSEVYLRQWLEFKKSVIASSTYNTYKINLEKHIIPAIGTFPISKITPSQIQKFYQLLINEKQMNHNTIRKIHSILVNSFDRAVKYELIAKNPAKLVEAPREMKNEVTVWDLDEVWKFLNVAKDSPYYMVYLIALNTGMRQGEILGLSWNEVDFESKQIKVTQTLRNDGKVINPTTKTAAGRRSIAVPEELTIALKRFKTLENTEENEYINKENLVLPSEAGSPINPSNLRRNFMSLINRAGVKKIRFHDLRHTHATLLLMQGVHPKIVSERLGHADTRMTLDRYSHLLPSMQKETAQKFGELLYGVHKKVEDEKMIDKRLLY
ncbi:tyrosine-type recombinase/integrase [Planococcus salinarum]|uniref:tyrosine-type recombinase/integrase n=1 Tax=Planococcus salinarum TaxID=622695 RepID=UPI001E572559|nr:tyrosine-type recombinase/integrase [Planococcus salinarum]